MPEKVKEETREFARALLAAGKTYREVAEALEISVGTVHNIAKEPRGDLGPIVEELRRRFSMKYWLLADHVLNRITEIDIVSASLKEKAIAAAIFTDKAVEMEKVRQKGLGPTPAGSEDSRAGNLNAFERPREDETPGFLTVNRPPRGF